MTPDKATIVRTPLFPTYLEVEKLLVILDGIRKDSVRLMINALFEQVGTPQSTVDWTEPDSWIQERLTGEDLQIAESIWQQSNKTINPRYIYGSYLFINTYSLLQPDTAGVYRLTDDGKDFINKVPAIYQKLDTEEGIPQVLSILASHSPAKRGDLLEEWSEFLQSNSNYGTASTIKDTLRRRLLNLVERGYATRSGNTYSITDPGIQYATSFGNNQNDHPHSDLLLSIKKFNNQQTALLRDRLESINPYRFEALIKELLEAMDYEDVQVTKQSGDKGVDVVASFQFGITQIKEVVQVKRHKSNITRPVLDQLRGALPYHQAIRGTIITTGGFAQGCKDAALYPGAAPITLIDGDKLIELLLKHGVGVRKKQQTLVELDDSYFDETPPETEQQEEV